MNRTKLENWICEIEALPNLTREGLEALQLKKLNAMLARLREQSRFYVNLPEHLESLRDLQTLPFTTAAELAKDPSKFLLTSQSEVSRVISGATSGTTGPAKRVFYTDTDTDRTIGFFASGISEMLQPGEKCFIAFPFTGPFGLGDLIAKAVKRLGGVPIAAGYGGSWEEMLRLLKKTQPQTYIGFPVTLLSLARLYGAGFPVRRALVSGDACPRGVMDTLEQLLGSKLFPHYGSRECGLGGAVTCCAHAGMHLRENHIIAQIVDSEGHTLPDGQWGELVITTIGADAMPLIRYRTGDRTRILPPCPCGGVTRRLDTVSREEAPVSMEALDSALFPIAGLIDYQARLEDSLVIRASTAAEGLQQLIHQQAQMLYPHLSVTVQTSLCKLEDLPMYMGKRHIL